jgi:hydrogenase nickel incorporation protein HypB
MCGHCGCGDEATTSVRNMQTGKETTMGRRSSRHSHDHEHGHEHLLGADAAHEHDHGREHSRGHEHRHEHSHGHPSRHGHDHDHSHDDEHEHERVRGHRTAAIELVELETRVLVKNDAMAQKNRAWFKGREILALNLVSSPGAGKTTLLERTIRDLEGELRLFVVEGDQATANDGERIRAAGAPAVQVNTGAGCHLEADMVARGLQELKPTAGSVVMIENVGNLVCPALFDLGERAKVVILSVTEGDDKPLKYPHMFRAAEIMILNKMDLLPYVDFDPARAFANALRVNPSISTIRLSARTGQGLEDWYGWLRSESARVKDLAFS